MFGSVNFTRVAAPIVYNFLMIINMNDTAFEDIMGGMNIVPIFG